MECSFCGSNKKREKYYHYHHIFPVELGGTWEDGMVTLCKYCHRKLHKHLNALKLIKKEDIINFTNKWLNREKFVKKNDMPFCPTCRDETKRLFISQIGKDYVLLYCSYCGYSEKSKEYSTYWINKEKYLNRLDNAQRFLNFNKKIEDLDGESI